MPEPQHAPTSQILLSTFISKLTGAYSSKIIANYIYGICAWHILHGITWLHNEPEIETLLKGATWLTPLVLKCKKCQPYTPNFMSKLKGQLNLQDPFNMAAFACLTTCFYTVGQVGEFTVNHLDDFDHAKHVTQANLREEED